MKQLRNKAGDLAMVIHSSSKYNGEIVLCIVEENFLWAVKTKSGKYCLFPDDKLLPLGGEHILLDDPIPELTQGSEAELEYELENE